MRIFVAGATGAIGRQLVPQLVAAGHQVVGTTRTPEKGQAVRAAGAEPVIMDALDRAAVRDAVMDAKPDVVVHQLTALAGMSSMRRFEADFALTNRLRTEGTEHLLDAARAAGTRRFVAQSFTGWTYGPVGDGLKAEDDPLDPSPPPQAATTLAAIRHLEAAVTGAEGIEGVVLRYGYFYGPGTSLSHDGPHLSMVRRRQFPLVGNSSGTWSFCHVADAATATVAAVGQGEPGLYNVVDDDPAPVAVWLPYLADVIGAKPPRRVPTWLARLMVGELGVAMMTTMRGVSNAKARRELGWRPAYASWRDGFRSGLG